MSIVALTNSSVAVDFAKQQLSDGLTIDRIVAQRMSSFVLLGAILGENAGLGHDHDPRHGGVTSRMDTEPIIETYLRAFLYGGEPACLAVLTAPYVKRTDPCVASGSQSLFFFDDEVYYFLTPKDNEESIHKTIRSSVNFGWTILLTQSFETIARGSTTTFEALDTLARNATRLLVDAYDHEAALVFADGTWLANGF